MKSYLISSQNQIFDIYHTVVGGSHNLIWSVIVCFLLYWTTPLLGKVMGQYCCLTNPKWGNLTIKYKHKCRGSHKTIKLGQYSSLWGFWNLVYNRLTPILNVKDLKFLVAIAKFLAGVYNNSTESVQSKLGCWQPAIPTNIPHERQSFSIWRQWKWWSHEKIQMKLMIGRENLW